MTSLSGATDMSVTPLDEVRRITEPKSTGTVGVVQPLIQAVVQELTVIVVHELVFGLRIAVKTDVRVDTGIGRKVSDFSAELHVKYPPIYEVKI